MSDYRFRDKPIESLSRAELIILIKWLMDRLKQQREANPLDCLRGIWNDNDR